MCHYCLLILPTAVLAMAYPGGAFGAEYGSVLALATGMFVLYGALSLPQGWIAARIGRKRLAKRVLRAGFRHHGARHSLDAYSRA